MSRAAKTVVAMVAAMAVLLPAGSAGAAGAFVSEEEEIARTWEGGYIFYPSGKRLRWGKIGDEVHNASAALAGRRYPTIVYMHGCSGVDIASTQTARDFLLKGGFVVVMPNSFARNHKPASCLLAQHRGGLHRSVIFWRQDEARNAIREARRLPFVDPNNIFLVGLSEGGITTATTTDNEPVNARIVEGWTCHAGWPEYFGLNAPPSEPVLALTGEDDPWFQKGVLKGDCGTFMRHANGSRAIVWEGPHELADQHYVLWHPEAMQAALDFLRRHMR